MTKIVFLTGAGISAESGIKTFRDENGLWDNHSIEEVASIDGWKKDRQKVLNFYNKRKNELDSVHPNQAHKLIAELEKNFEVCVITQNVDDLHERAGSSNVVHLHGELKKMCSSLDKTKTLPYIDDINIGDKHPDGSQLRPFIVWFGEDVPLIDKAAEEISTADIFVIVGTSLQVYPAAGLMRCATANCELYYIDPNPKLDEVSYYFNIIEDVATSGMKKLTSILNPHE